MMIKVNPFNVTVPKAQHSDSTTPEIHVSHIKNLAELTQLFSINEKSQSLLLMRRQHPSGKERKIHQSISSLKLVTKGLQTSEERGLDKSFMIRDFDNKEGVVKREFQDSKLPRSSEESYVPYGITSNSTVVYAKTGEHRGFNQVASDLKPYTTEVSQERRRLAASELGAFALSKSQYTEKAVKKVSEGINQYLMDNFKSNPEKTMDAVVKGIGHYFFTDGGLSFGRISEQNIKTHSNKYVWDKILDTLDNGSLDQKISIHDAVGRKVLPKLGGEQLTKYEALGQTVRQDWFDSKNIRGRVNRAEKPKASHTIGIASDKNANIVGSFEQPRNRGVDMFERDVNRTNHPEANKFFDDIDSRNLLFGAGISGTTGTLLQAAEAFGPLTEMEDKKQYMMAIVGYLVGGGMHSYHECMTIGEKVGIPYRPGSYVESLPESFTSSEDFQRWNHDYYDISVLGATHWQFNEGKLPAHLELQKKMEKLDEDDSIKNSLIVG
ncbi:hypothetical protein [Vibrio azureus]|uniref:Uncharacterized protein n=1 Tax=Vibrio azureus NBRC 104587 TaxID=1219077 RepID=U3AY39_9VIBR|nr:hypothetical protein [Vibrio azureus]GAD78142.1 hypothetical protein VAZ01S_131_00030 [Vibrio azureus NBRC 104587]